MAKLGVGGKCAWCLTVVVIFMGLGIAYRLRRDFKVTIWGASHKRVEQFSMGAVGP